MIVKNLNKFMYVVFYGNDRGGVRDAGTNYIEKNLPSDGCVTTVEATNFEPGQLSDALGASSLFGGAEWFVLDTPSLNPDFMASVKESLSELSESANTFVVLEDSLLAAPKKAYEKYAVDSKEFKLSKTERFNSFSLAEALATKDKRKLWVLLQESKMSGSRAEETVGILWWQLKSLRLASLTNSAEEAGMKDFPYSKAKRALSKFAPKDADQLSHSLLKLYHEGHGGVRDMDEALEEWVLQV